MTPITDLIARIEAATGPSRAFDAEIENMIAGGSAADLAYILTDVENITRAPRFTFSIDAALTLIPEGIFSASLSVSFNKSPGRQFCHATLERDADSLGRDMTDGEECVIRAIKCATPALALCAAALKARGKQE